MQLALISEIILEPPIEQHPGLYLIDWFSPIAQGVCMPDIDIPTRVS